MRLLLIGDIVGKPGRQIVCRSLKPLIAREQLDFVIANAENTARNANNVRLLRICHFLPKGLKIVNNTLHPWLAHGVPNVWLQ